jgi:hypothetical protein
MHYNTKVWYATALEQAGQADRAKAVSPTCVRCRVLLETQWRPDVRAVFLCLAVQLYEEMVQNHELSPVAACNYAVLLHRKLKQYEEAERSVLCTEDAGWFC